MDRLILPDIFDGCVNPFRNPEQGFFSNGVKAFFTKKSLGTDIKKISSILSIKKDNIFFPLQRHTDKVLVVESDIEPKIADGVVTEREGILIGVQVADCVPIILFDRKKLIIGAVHAGWRGTAAQIIKKTIRSMVECFGSLPDDIAVALGPSIRWDCYHVNHEVKDAICKATGYGNYYIEKSEGGYCVDLSSANMFQVLSLGVPEENIWSSHECTYCSPEEFYSYRYSKNLNGAQGGFIGIL
ncbi:MAG: peptidoglycan editing factor PgeF [Nitrospirota bacterium]